MTPHQLDRALDDLIHLDPAASVHPQRDSDAVLDQIYNNPSPVLHAHRGPRHWLLGAVALAAASAAVLVTANGLIGPPDAYAGWTHTPQPVDAVRDHATAEQCHTWVSQTGPQHLPATPILTDRRGDWNLALLITKKGPVTCLIDGQSGREPSGGTSGPLDLPASAPTAGIVLTSVSGTARDDDPIVRTIVGKIAPDITAVTLHTAAQGDVHATLLNGWAIAWWPGENEGHELLDKNGLLAPGYDTVRITRKDGTTTTLPAKTVSTSRP